MTSKSDEVPITTRENRVKTWPYPNWWSRNRSRRSPCGVSPATDWHRAGVVARAGSAPYDSPEERSIVPHRQAHGLRVDVLIGLAVELVAQRLATLGEPPKQFADDGVGLLGRALWVVQEAELDGLPARAVALQLAGTKDLEVTVCRGRPPQRGVARACMPVLQHCQPLARYQRRPSALGR